MVVAYDDRWPARFAAEVERLTPLLLGADIHHIGSTAVPGLAAKPVIDLMALVADLDEPIPALVDRGGYEYPAAYNATLVDRYRDDREGYTEAKAAFIELVVAG